MYNFHFFKCNFHFISGNACLGIDCSQHGVCEVTISGFRCNCEDDFEGSLCQTAILPGEKLNVNV